MMPEQRADAPAAEPPLKRLRRPLNFTPKALKLLRYSSNEELEQVYIDTRGHVPDPDLLTGDRAVGVAKWTRPGVGSEFWSSEKAASSAEIFASSPAEVPAVPAVIRPDVSPQARAPQPPQQALGYSRIDWAEMGRETQQKRVAVLRKILNDPRESSDSFKMLLVGEKMDNFQQEDELLQRIQGLEATDLPPPGTPHEHNRKIQVAMLLEELLMMRTLLYGP